MKKVYTLILVSILLPAFSCKNSEKAEVKKEIEQVKTQIKEIQPDMEKLLTPTMLTEKAPETFKVRFRTTKGDILLEIYRNWAPNGADRVYNLVKNGFFKDIAFFRVLKGFVAQFGISGDPKISAVWRTSQIQDDPVKASNTRGTITFATAGPNTRTTQLFINYGDNSRLDSMGFSPIGKVVEGMDIVENLYGDYGEGYPNGNGPNQSKIQMEGNDYLKTNYTKLDYILSASLE